MAKPPLNVVWCNPPAYLWEEDWIRSILTGFELAEFHAPQLDCYPDGALFVISSNFHPLRDAHARMRGPLASVKGKGLFHLSDEWYSGGYEFYREFDFALRNHHSSIFRNKGILTLPLGLTNGAKNTSHITPASQRPYIWTFAGTRTATRMQMYGAFESLRPSLAYWYDLRRQERPPLDRREFKKLLSQTIFQPCPMGNVMLETFRVYEALEMGCIPLIEQRTWMPYYDRLLPDHPLPSFTQWQAARTFVETYRDKPEELDRLQQRVHGWWQQTKTGLSDEVSNFITAGLNGAFTKDLSQDWQSRSGMGHQLWRLQELVRHGNRASLTERAGIMARRLISATRSA